MRNYMPTSWAPPSAYRDELEQIVQSIAEERIGPAPDASVQRQDLMRQLREMSRESSRGAGERDDAARRFARSTLERSREIDRNFDWTGKRDAQGRGVKAMGAARNFIRALGHDPDSPAARGLGTAAAWTELGKEGIQARLERSLEQRQAKAKDKDKGGGHPLLALLQRML